MLGPAESGSRLVRLGDVIVDTATLIIADPGYIASQSTLEQIAAVGEAIRETPHGGQIMPDGRNPNLKLGVGIKLEGDGGYPVWGVLDEAGVSLIRVIIDLQPPDSEEG